MADKFGDSTLWEVYHRTRITRASADDLTGFKSGAVNYKLGLWDPAVNGVRYLKALIHNVSEQLTEADWQRLRRIAHRDVGNPISVRTHGEDVCMDYLQAVLELGFVERQVDLAGARVVEIGAGYGRTCHALLANHDLAGYTIVDLPNSLELARAYLRQVLPVERFDRIEFVLAAELGELPAAQRFDLCLNIDSFAEMPAGTVRHYLDWVAGRCAHLYVKNPVGKYLDRSLDGHSQGGELVALALKTGLLRDVLDIHDTAAVAAKAQDFRDAYRPAPDWDCAADAWAPPWTYYWQALYRAGAR